MKKYILILIIATSCSPMYLPNARNAPLFRGAGEVQVSAHVGQGYDLQGGVAITDHIGAMANYSHTSNTSVDDESDYINHNFFEGGVGYYENTGKLCYEIYAGYGKGKGTTYDEYNFLSGQTTIKATGQYNRFFIQPAIGSNVNRIFNWTVAARFSLVDFTRFESSTQSIAVNGEPALFIEPSFIGKINFGSSKMFMAFQVGLSVTQHETYFEYEPLFLSLGMGLRLGRIGKSKEE